MSEFDVSGENAAFTFEQQIVANIQDGLIVLGRDLRYQFWNAAMERISGLPAEAVLGKKPLELFPFLKDVGVESMINRALSGETIVTPDFPYEVKVTGANGWTSQTMAPLRDSKGEIVGVISTVRDVTERVRIDQEIRASRQRLETLSRQLLRVQEEERRHLARELHDEIGQVLTAIKMNLNETQRAADARLQPFVKDNIAMIDQAIVQVRNLSLNLRPAQLDLLGLVPALRWLFTHHTRLAKVNASAEFETGDLKIPVDLEVVCFRIAQEALTNAIRHGKPRNVRGKLWSNESTLFLSIQDDGLGFDVSASRSLAMEGNSFGLLSMYERASLVGGQLKIDSKPGHGSTIHAEFPLSL